MKAAGLFGLAIMGSCSLGGTASAADLAVKARPAPVPVFSWTGFYVGLNAGYGTAGSSSVNVPNPTSNDVFTNAVNFGPTDFNSAFRQTGWIAGGQAGYNWQVSDRWVAGIEADLQYADVRGSDFHRAFLNPGFFGTNFGFNAVTERKLEWFGTVRGRLGILVSPGLLLYGTGGLAYGETRTSGDIVLAPAGTASFSTLGGFRCVTTVATPISTCFTGNNNQTSVGWTAGLGGEFKIGGNWTAKLEYLHVDLPGSSVTLASPAPPSAPGITTTYRFNRQSYDFFRIGLNYKWGGSQTATRY